MKTEQEHRVRKSDIQRGTRTQKHMAFRVDLDLIPWLEEQANKGRYINDLVRHDKEKKKNQKKQEKSTRTEEPTDKQA